MSAHTAPYGAWVSPISEESLVQGRIGFEPPIFDGDRLVWSESRPLEGGRLTLMLRHGDGRLVDLLPTAYNARTTVHEYGGGAYWCADGTVWFSNFADQRIYRVREGEEPVALTPPGTARFADFRYDAPRDRLICVREDHGQGEVVNHIVAVPCTGGAIEVLASGADFYACPRLDDSGQRLAYVCWNHPNMPWNDTALWVAELDEAGLPTSRQQVAGLERESITQPEWAPDGRLVFISDRNGWWNLYQWQDGQVHALHERAAEFSQPMWQFGQPCFGFAGNRVIALYSQDGSWSLAGLDAKTGTPVDYPLPYSQMYGLAVAGERAALVAAAPDKPAVLLLVNLLSGSAEVLRRSIQTERDPRYFSMPEAIRFPTGEGEFAHGFHYPPTNPDFVGPVGSLPPLITIVHGGPTSASSNALSLGVQYWTSRGFAVLDVNHRGSSGYGRAYRDRLDGAWGIVDVEDAVNGSRYLAEQGKVDPEKLIIRGGSAGGFTTLAALTFHDVFRAGASYYGVSDLELLAQETHKFESRYLDRLIGPYPERADLYRARAPIHHLAQLDRPVLLLQGLDDKVVPPSQSERILEALRDRGVPVAYVPFAGEQHGFRKAENIVRAYRSEWTFYARVFGFGAAADFVDLEIHHLPAAH